MIDITEQCEYNMSDPVLKYCVSWIINFLFEDAVKQFMELPHNTKNVRMYSSREHVSH